MPRLVTEWSTDDPTISKALDLVASTPAHSSARYELEATLHTFQARICWQDAQDARRREREQAARDARRAARQEAR